MEIIYVPRKAMRLSEIMMLKATVLPSCIRQRMKERKEVVRTALKGTFC